MQRNVFLTGAAAALAGLPARARAQDGDLAAAAVRAYIFAYPLVLVALTEQRQLAVTARNQFRHDRELATPANRFIVRPNVDTLYSSAFVDLRQGPVLLTVPPSAGHFFVCEVMDAWTNVFADPGTRTTGAAPQRIVFARSDQHPILPAGYQRVEAPTDVCWFFNRIALHAGSDAAAVHAMQDGFALTPFPGGATLPGVDHGANDPTKLGAAVAAMAPETFFDVAARRLAANPAPPGDEAGVRDLARLGIVPGQPVRLDALTPAAQTAVRAAPAAALQRITTLGALPLTATRWTRPDPRIGRFGAADLFRAKVAAYGIAANRPADALYYATASVGSQQLRFAAGLLPPQNGFWSLTMYDLDGYLVPNPIGRYALRSGDAFVPDADGGLTLDLAPSAPSDAARGANWLPAPAGPYTLLLRLYWPLPPALEGTWIPPALG
jgi:hypothetical protein